MVNANVVHERARGHMHTHTHLSNTVDQFISICYFECNIIRVPTASLPLYLPINLPNDLLIAQYAAAMITVWNYVCPLLEKWWTGNKSRQSGRNVW